MSDLVNNQWELDGYTFGMNLPLDHEADVAPSLYTVRSQDAVASNRDGANVGRDYLEPGSWSFKLFVNLEDEDGALAELARVAKVWRADEVRASVGEVLPLRYRMAGRTRRVYGRPRRFDYTTDNRKFDGYIPVTCDFKVVSELFFDDEEESYPLGQLAPTTGGFEAPFEAPLTTEEEDAVFPYSFTVGGALPTPGVFDITGPVSDPVIDIDNGDMVIQLVGTIPSGRTVTVDARPWRMIATVRDNNAPDDSGSPVPGIISRRTRLPRLMLKPGAHIASFSGIDETGTSTAKVRWRRAHPSV